MAKRAIVIVLDGVGAGTAPDAQQFGDFDSPSTIHHVFEACHGLDVPTLAKLGLLSAGQVPGLEDQIDPHTRWGRLQELSQGKDSVTGHWEMMGAVTTVAFPTYPNGFPIPLIKAFEDAIGTQVLGNRAASGTAILTELGPQHVDTGFPIVYTSADSVFQVAAHESVVPLAQLYEWCAIAREMLVAPNNVQRVIARPFVGDAKGGYSRTQNRKDFPLAAPKNLVDAVGDVFGIGVISELFDGRGFRQVRRTQNNAAHGEMLLEALASDARFIFANFEDTDMLFGHRNDPQGFGNCLAEFDRFLTSVLPSLSEDDLLLITADHGNDPTSTSTDHSREYVPVCVWNSQLVGKALGDVAGMSAIGATVADWIGVPWSVGTNLLF